MHPQKYAIEHKKKVTSAKTRHQLKQATTDCCPIRRQRSQATENLPCHHRQRL